MAAIGSLIETKTLRMTLLADMARGKGLPLFFTYDDECDSLIFLFVPPVTETVVHYVDEHVGLLYQPDDRQVVGMQVESFQRSFVPRYASVQRAWRLRDACKGVTTLADLEIAFKKHQPEVAQEVARVTEDILGNQGRAAVPALV